MSLIIIPQHSFKSSSWKPEVIEKPNFVSSLYKLVERNTMSMETCTFYFDKKEFECIKFVSNAGTAPNVVYHNTKGPVVYYKKDGFSKEEEKYMVYMIEKVIGKQPLFIIRPGKT